MFSTTLHIQLCRGIQDLCSEEANISQSWFWGQPPKTVTVLPAVPEPNFGPKTAVWPDGAGGQFWAGFWKPATDDCLFASANPWPNKPKFTDFTCKSLYIGDDDEHDDGLDEDDGYHVHAHFVSVQFFTQVIRNQDGAPSVEKECMKCAPKLQCNVPNPIWWWRWWRWRWCNPIGGDDDDA